MRGCVLLVFAWCLLGVCLVLAWCWLGVGLVFAWCWLGVGLVFAWCVQVVLNGVVHAYVSCILSRLNMCACW